MAVNRPAAFSRWTHREKGGDYTFLTIAKGTGADHGVDFAYYLGLDKATGLLYAFVRRFDDWDNVMVPLQPDGEDDDLDDLI